MPIDSSGSICTATVRLMPVAYSKPLGLSPVPDVGQMPGKASRDDEHGIDADDVAGSRVAWGQAFRRHGNAAQAILVERPSGCFL